METILGLESGAVRVVEYEEEWIQAFEHERTALMDALGNRAVDIQHIGSTAIPGMPSKPILDIAVGVEKYKEALGWTGSVERLGYEYRGERGVPRRLYFVRGEREGPR
ncbi:GrpB family protein [Acidobacteriota bacterium]